MHTLVALWLCAVLWCRHYVVFYLVFSDGPKYSLWDWCLCSYQQSHLLPTDSCTSKVLLEIWWQQIGNAIMYLKTYLCFDNFMYVYQHVCKYEMKKLMIPGEPKLVLNSLCSPSWLRTMSHLFILQCAKDTRWTHFFHEFGHAFSLFPTIMYISSSLHSMLFPLSLRMSLFLPAP